MWFTWVYIHIHISYLNLWNFPKYLIFSYQIYHLTILTVTKILKENLCLLISNSICSTYKRIYRYLEIEVKVCPLLWTHCGRPLEWTVFTILSLNKYVLRALNMLDAEDKMRTSWANSQYRNHALQDYSVWVTQVMFLKQTRGHIVGHFHWYIPISWSSSASCFPFKGWVGPVVCSDPGRAHGPFTELLRLGNPLRILSWAMKRKGIRYILEMILEIVDTLVSIMESLRWAS